MPVVDPTQCVAKIASKLQISEKTKRYGIKVLREAQEHEESAGKDPMGLAAALHCIYHVLKMAKIELKEILQKLLT